MSLKINKTIRHTFYNMQKYTFHYDKTTIKAVNISFNTNFGLAEFELNPYKLSFLARTTVGQSKGQRTLYCPV